MLQAKFSLENLPQLDYGKISEAFNHEIEHVVKDCQDRPLDKTARTVTIQFSLLPEANVDGGHAECENVAVACDITSKVPKRKTRVYVMKPKHDGSLAFHPDSPEDSDANLLYDEARAAEVAKVG